MQTDNSQVIYGHNVNMYLKTGCNVQDSECKTIHIKLIIYFWSRPKCLFFIFKIDGSRIENILL